MDLGFAVILAFGFGPQGIFATFVLLTGNRRNSVIYTLLKEKEIGIEVFV